MTFDSASRPQLWIIASVVWLAWLLGVLVMWFDYRWRVMHPHFFPLLSLLSLQAAAGLTLLVAGLWRVVRGPQRIGALGWLLLGTAPVWLSVGHFSYGAWTLYEQHAALNTPVKMACGIVASLADAAVRIRYPKRYEGEHVVMVYDSVANPAGQVAAMDRHVERMEAILGRSRQGKAHWIRGPVFARHGWYLQGLSVASEPAEGDGGDELMELDRHEVAHYVIDQHCGPDAQPPCLLVEGWAESQSGYQPGWIALRAWQRKQRGEVLSLRELTSVGWYASGNWPVYDFGGALVEYLLDEFGGQTFLELYVTCRRETFAEDCRRVLGADLDELDRQYWNHVLERVKQFYPERINPLLSVPLADEVDPDAWLAFSNVYPDAAEKLKASCRQFHGEFAGRMRFGTKQEQPARYEFNHDGVRHRMTLTENGVQGVIVASPVRSFLLSRRDDNEPWSPDEWESQGRKSEDYWANQRLILEYESDLHGGSYATFRSWFIDRSRNDSFRVTRFLRVDDGQESAVHVDFEFTNSPNDFKRREGRFTLLPGRSYAVKEYEVRDFDADGGPVLWRGSFEYPADSSAATIPRVIHRHSESPKSSFHLEVVQTRREFHASGEVFEPASYGVRAARIESRFRAPWYVTLPAVAAPISLFAGLLFSVVAFRQDRGVRIATPT